MMPFTSPTSPGSRSGMARVDVAVSSDLSPERAWKLASDLRRFGEWLTIFDGWRSEDVFEVDPLFRGQQEYEVLRCS